jgi:glycosyltransferase involved in cell wall biosynthesis
MRLLLLNQFVPPDQAPTARLLGDLADAFADAGWESLFIGKQDGYREGKKRGLARLIRDGLAHGRMFWAALRAGPCDWIVCLSDPPGLPFTAALLARIKRARLAHWAMDVYPEVAVQLGALPSGWASRWVGAAMTFGYRQCDLLVALDADMRRVIEGRLGPSQVKIQPPWPPTLMPTPATRPPSNTTRTWLYSGNLGRAHEFRDVLEAQRLLEAAHQPWRLVFQGGGPSYDEARAYAAHLGLKQCQWQNYAPEDGLLESLLQADVLIATQKESMLGLLWPSKLAVLQLTGRPILWVGPATGQIGASLRADSAKNGVFAPGDAAAIAQWISNLAAADAQTLPSVEEVLQRSVLRREQGLAHFTQWLLQAQAS